MVAHMKKSSITDSGNGSVGTRSGGAYVSNNALLALGLEVLSDDTY